MYGGREPKVRGYLVLEGKANGRILMEEISSVEGGGSPMEESCKGRATLPFKKCDSDLCHPNDLYSNRRYHKVLPYLRNQPTNDHRHHHGRPITVSNMMNVSLSSRTRTNVALCNRARASWLADRSVREPSQLHQ